MDSTAENYHLFYTQALEDIKKTNLPFLIGGTYAIMAYTGIVRDTKDMDVFCKAGDYPSLLNALKKLEYKIEINDERWTAKAYKGDLYIDVVFGSPSGLSPIDDLWFERASEDILFGKQVKLVPIEELIWTNMYIQGRHRYNGADINHLILKKADNIDWKHLLMRVDPHWEIFFGCLLNFRFVYPSERDRIPRWLIEKLLKRINEQLALPTPKDKVCRGPLLSPDQYEVDIKEWGFKALTYSM